MARKSGGGRWKALCVLVGIAIFALLSGYLMWQVWRINHPDADVLDETMFVLIGALVGSMVWVALQVGTDKDAELGEDADKSAIQSLGLRHLDDETDE